MKDQFITTVSLILVGLSLAAVPVLPGLPQDHRLSLVPTAAAAEPVSAEPVGIKSGDILLAYPRGEDNNKIDSPSTFLIGAVPPGRKLICNGQAVSINTEGYFAHTVKLKHGKNNFSLTLSEQESPLTFCVERPAQAACLSTGSFKILPASLEPHEDMGLRPQDIVQFAARATPGCQLSVRLAGRQIVLKPALRPGSKHTAASVNLGLATAFGVSFEPSAAAVKDLYLGFYRIQAEDHFQKAVPVFVLKKGKQTTKATARGSLSVVSQPQMLETAHANTIVRLGPGAARTTPLPQSVRMLADGFKGEWWRLELCPGRHVWINKEDMLPAEESTALPESKVSTVNLGSDSYGASLSIPLNQRLPYQIEQDIAGKKLKLTIFGATADTDFVTGDLHPDSALPCAGLIDYASWKQKSDLQYELSVQLNSKQQWGYFADYQDRSLSFHIKSAPCLDPASGSLKGAVICLDPGHGGREPGAIGCSGVREAVINLAIADKLQRELTAQGASVIMTRTDDRSVSLQERVDRAIAAKADLLVSIHNNALPDNRDPNLEHGSSSYWYHPQSHELSLVLQKDLVLACASKDYGCRYQNLALCRPSHMLASLLEVGFMINPDEYAKLLNPQYQEQAGRAIAESIKKFLFERVKDERP
jgi:N-acetylmuramoyl-L-alanine amidase